MLSCKSIGAAVRPVPTGRAAIIPTTALKGPYQAQRSISCDALPRKLDLEILDPAPDSRSRTISGWTKAVFKPGNDFGDLGLHNLGAGSSEDYHNHKVDLLHVVVSGGPVEYKFKTGQVLELKQFEATVIGAGVTYAVKNASDGPTILMIEHKNNGGGLWFPVDKQ